MELKLVLDCFLLIEQNMSEKKLHPFLFHHNFRIAGIILLVPALFFTFFRFYLGEKPEFLKQKILAIYSSFLEVKYFSIIENNLSEEICGLLIFLSLVLIVFSKEKKENENFWAIRYSSMFTAVYSNIVILVISILFVFGLAFVNILLLNMYLLLVIYFLVFKIRLHKFSLIKNAKKNSEPIM